MSKFLLIGSVAALLYGDCAWGMDYDESEIYENPRKDMKSQSEDTQTPISRLERQKKALQQVNQQLENQTQITQLRQTNFQRSENIESKDRYKFIGNRLYYYKKSKDQKVYKEFATPTTVDSAANDLNGILEITQGLKYISSTKLLIFYGIVGEILCFFACLFTTLLSCNNSTSSGRFCWKCSSLFNCISNLVCKRVVHGWVIFVWNPKSYFFYTISWNNV